ncbi:glycosyltransferase family 4 protein [Massilia psychrophila]|uniref:glycosyltransferase family 4 protein n=1 Tax=Massilia psychrophila TaxID=1603353 RepID=UPI0015D4B3C4|nr:glycosyltransferase family 1 protein [Massilia psychrophila]
MDDIIQNVQKFGGASTYWHELTTRLPEFVLGPIVHSTANKYMRLYSPTSSAKVFHSSHFRVSSSRGTKNVTTIHDLIYEKGLGGGRGKIVNLYERKKSVVKADAIICISESTRCDLYECYAREIGSKPVYVIHHGCSRLISSPAMGIAAFGRLRARGYDLESRQFFLFVGGRSGYKNFELLLQAFAAGGLMKQGLLIVCTGAALSEQERQLIESLKLTEAVISIGFVDVDTVGALYGIARALVYPSAYEGFGLPPLEAMAAGCPVICANSSSLPEVIGESGILIDPRSVEQLSIAMSTMLDDQHWLVFSRAGIARAALFDWRESARKHADVYASLVSF